MKQAVASTNEIIIEIQRYKGVLLSFLANGYLIIRIRSNAKHIFSSIVRKTKIAEMKLIDASKVHKAWYWVSREVSNSTVFA